MSKSIYDHELFAAYTAKEKGDFRDWLRKNRELFDLFWRLAEGLLTKGHRQRYGAKAIVEAMRWHNAQADGNSTFKLNNNRTAMMSRLLVIEDKRFADVFRFRLPVKGSKTRGRK